MLAPDELGVIAGRLKRQAFEAGELIFEQGDRGDAMFIIRLGRVRIYSQGERGKELTLNVYGEGDFFGEFSLPVRRQSSGQTPWYYAIRT
jgi:CRP-like cAMP-binding protein